MHKIIMTLFITLAAFLTFSQEVASEVPTASEQPTPVEPVVNETPAAATPAVAEAPKPVKAQPLPPVEVQPAPLPSTPQPRPEFSPMVQNDSTAPGILVVTTFPETAKLALNGIAIGTGTVTVPNLPPGRYVVTASTEGKTDMKEVLITPGGLTKADVSVKKKAHMYISVGNMITFFTDDQDNAQIALGPHFEIGVSIRNKVLITQDFHWGFWSKGNDTTSSSDNVTTSGRYDAVGGNIKVFWQTMTPKEHFGFFLGAGMGFYSISDYSYYYYDDYGYGSAAAPLSSFNGDYFGGPSAMMIFGGPIAYGTLSYDLRVGSGLAHALKIGIATYF